MSPSPPSETQTLTYVFFITLGITVLVYVLRGFGVAGFTALPGGVIWLLILLSIATGLVYGVQRTRRYWSEKRAKLIRHCPTSVITLTCLQKCDRIDSKNAQKTSIERYNPEFDINWRVNKSGTRCCHLFGCASQPANHPHWFCLGVTCANWGGDLSRLREVWDRKSNKSPVRRKASIIGSLWRLAFIVEEFLIEKKFNSKALISRSTSFPKVIECPH